MYQSFNNMQYLSKRKIIMTLKRFPVTGGNVKSDGQTDSVHFYSTST